MRCREPKSYDCKANALLNTVYRYFRLLNCHSHRKTTEKIFQLAPYLFSDRNCTIVVVGGCVGQVEKFKIDGEIVDGTKWRYEI